MGKSVCWNNGDDGYEIDIKKEKIKAEVTLLRQNDDFFGLLLTFFFKKVWIFQNKAVLLKYSDTTNEKNPHFIWRVRIFLYICKPK